MHIDDIEAVSRLAATVEGWLSDAQGRALYLAARTATRGGLIVEIGSWKGRSTVWLARGAGRTIYAVDPHANSREDPQASTLSAFRANIERAGVTGTVEAAVMTSAEAVRAIPGSVELLFVDGDHSPEGARRDAELWLPRIMNGGTVMFHDVATSGYSGPRRVFQRQICWHGGYRCVRKVGSMAIAERTDGQSAFESVQAAAFGARLYFYDLQGAVKRALRWMRRALRLYPSAGSCS